MPSTTNQKIGQISKEFNADSINAELDLLHERINAQVESGELFVGRKAVDKVTYNVSPGDMYIGVVHSQAAVTIILPSAADAYKNKIYMVKDEANIATSNNITITAQQGEKIDKSQTTTITSSLGVKRFFSTGQEWFTI